MFTDNDYPVYIKEELYQKAINTAMLTHGTSAIFPCGNKTVFDECFTHEEDMIIFWFDIDILNGRTTRITTTYFN